MALAAVAPLLAQEALGNCTANSARYGAMLEAGALELPPLRLPSLVFTSPSSGPIGSNRSFSRHMMGAPTTMAPLAFESWPETSQSFSEAHSQAGWMMEEGEEGLENEACFA